MRNGNSSDHLWYIPDLARRNINITNFIELQDKLYVIFEYQWRSPKNNAYRWARSFIVLPPEVTDNTIAEQVKLAVIEARKGLEGQGYGHE